MLAVLEESDTPLHYKEVHRRVMLRKEKDVEIRRIQGSLADLGALLFDRGTYGVPRHLKMDDDDALAIVHFCEQLILSGDQGRQWHANELVEALFNAQVDAPPDVDQYLLNNVLILRATSLKYLGRFIWSGKATTKQRSRVDIAQACISLLKAHGRPMTTHELRDTLRQHRGLGVHFQIHPEGDLIRLEPARWGILSRDIALHPNDISSRLDELVSHLEQKAVGATADEIASLLNQGASSSNESGLSVSFWLGMVARDNRFILASPDIVGLRTWGTTRRLTLRQAVDNVVRSLSGPVKVSELIRKVSAASGREVDFYNIYSHIRTRMQYDDVEKLWHPTVLNENIDEDDARD